MKRMLLFGLAGLLTSTAVVAEGVNDLSDNGPLEIYLDNDETGDAQFRIRAGDIGADGSYTGGDVLFEIKPDTTYSNATGVGDMMTTINTDATISGDATIAGDLVVNGSIKQGIGYDLLFSSPGDGNLNSNSGAISLSAGENGGSNGSITLDANGAGGSISLEAGANTSTLNLADQSITANTSGVITLTATGNNGIANPAVGVTVSDDNAIELITTGVSPGDIMLQSVDDIELFAIDNISLDAADDIELYGDDVEVYALEDLEMLAMRLGGATNNVDTNEPLTTGYGGVLAIQGKDTNRYIADSNGKIVLLDASLSDSDWDGSVSGDYSAESIAAGTTGQFLVGDAQGNMRGLVIQENKTTLSGGQNAASLTLDTRGATFSNPTTGAPIQVHGVADGTADFDAVNVRQLYSGLAAVMAASTPELRLEPGKSSAAFGVGLYGGHSGVGFGVGHMFDNNTVLTFSAGKAAYSEPAYKASFSWTW